MINITNNKNTKALNATLNLPGFHTISAVSFSVLSEETYSFDDVKKYDNYPSVSISDCNSVIQLDLSTDNDEGFRNSLYKLQTLIESLELAQEFLYEAKEYNERYTRAMEIYNRILKNKDDNHNKKELREKLVKKFDLYVTDTK